MSLLCVPIASAEPLALSTQACNHLGTDAVADAFLVSQPPTGRIEPSFHLTKLASLHLFDDSKSVPFL